MLNEWGSLQPWTMILISKVREPFYTGMVLTLSELVIRGTCLLVTVDQAEANQDIIGVLAL